MAPNKQLARVFSALGNETRLEILNMIEKNISNPGEIAQRKNMPRSTIEKHFRVMLAAGAVNKIPSLSPEGQLRVYYKITDITKNLIEMARNCLDDSINLEE